MLFIFGVDESNVSSVVFGVFCCVWNLLLVTTDGDRISGVCVCGIASRPVSGMAIMSGMSSGRVSGMAVVSDVIWVFWWSVVFCFC